MADEIKTTDLADAVFIAGAKIILEKALTPAVGNGNLYSGLAKVVGASVVDKFVEGKWGKIIKTALMVDGAEDIAVSLMNGLNVPFVAREEPAYL